MNEEELLSQATNVPSMYFDGFGAFRKINGVLRCVGYVLGSGAQLNLIVSLVGAEAAYLETKRALDSGPNKSAIIAQRMRLAH